MGWRISFGVGPLRYSAPLTSRRRRTTYRPAPRVYQPAERYVVTPEQKRRDRIVILVSIGAVLLLTAGLFLWPVIAIAMR